MKNELSPAPLKMGQVWQLGNCRIEIGFVGRTLVHYRRLRGPVARASADLVSQQALGLELSDAKAVLLDEAAWCPPAGLLRSTKSLG